MRDGAYVGVDGAELPAPLGVVEEGPVVETVVVRTVRLGVHGRRDHRHLVPVDGVAAVKVFHLRRGGGGGVGGGVAGVKGFSPGRGGGGPFVVDRQLGSIARVNLNGLVSHP